MNFVIHGEWGGESPLILASIGVENLLTPVKFNF